MAYKLPGSIIFGASRRRKRPPASSLQWIVFLHQQRDLSSTTSNNDGKDKKEEKDAPDDRASEANFNIIAANSSASAARRFNLSTSGEQKKVPVFKDLTRNRDPSWEREMEHTTFISYLPKQLQQYEKEREYARSNPLVRDQQNLIINKDDASNRKWLSGPQEAGGSYMERDAMANKSRLSGVQDAVIRKRTGVGGVGGSRAARGDLGVPEEGMDVEQKIQLAMAQGDFDNLKGKGKPLTRYTEGQYFEDRTSHLFMDVLHKSGIKPVWVDRSSKIKEMQSLILRRLQAEWAKLLLQETSSSSPSSSSSSLTSQQVASLRRKWRDQIESLPAIRNDVAFINNEIDLYNLQVPSMTLQRMRFKLDILSDIALSQEEDDTANGGDRERGMFLTDGKNIDVKAAQSFLRQADRDGLLSPITSFGSLRLDKEDERNYRSAGGKGRGGLDDSNNHQGEQPQSFYGDGNGGEKGGKTPGILDSLTSWFTSSSSKKK